MTRTAGKGGKAGTVGTVGTDKRDLTRRHARLATGPGRVRILSTLPALPALPTYFVTVTVTSS